MTRLIRAEDFDFIYGLYMHPQLNPWLLYEMMDKKAFQPIFDELLTKQIIYIFSADGKAVGMFKLIHQEHRNAHNAYLGGVAIHPGLAGKGYGTKMMEEIIGLGKRWGLKRIELSTATTNERALRLYQKAGFEKEGVLRKYTWLLSEDRYIDEVMMSYLY